MKRDLTPAQLAQEVTVTLPLSAVLQLNEQAAPMLAVAQAASLPAIGADYEGGKFAGLTLHEGQPHALVLLPGDEKKTWSEGVAWAKLNGGRLPSRIDQLVLFKNMKGEFQEQWYWSGEQSAGNAAYAWYQYFSDGDQNNYHKGTPFRCRAVRSLPIR